MSIRRRSFLTPLLAVIVLGGAAPEAGTLEIFFIDVLGGAATLLVTPERESILIDSGWPGHDDRDPRRVVHVLKDVAGLSEIDHLVTTHWHVDHYGGVEGLARRVPIRRFWDRGLPDPKADDSDRARFPDGPRPDDPLGEAYRRAAGDRRRGLNAGDTIPLRGAVTSLVLASGGRVVDAPDAPRNAAACADAPPDLPADPSDNARSLALRFRFGKFDFLDCGDLTWNVEKLLVCPGDQVGPIDLFQVTHHGMSISNHPTLLRTIAPTVAVTDNGPRKGGDAATVARLRSLPSIRAAYQLHKNAATTDAENGDPALIANATAEGGQFIRVTVAPGGSRFVVRFGADGAPTEYAAK